MRKNILAAALLLAVASQTAHLSAQNRMRITQNTFALQGDSVLVDMSIELNRAQIAKRGFVLLTPYLEDKKSGATMDLPAVMINGKNRQKAYRRLVAIHREPVYVGQVIDASAKNAPRSYNYSAVIPYEPWMLKAGFLVREDQCECNGPIVPVTFELMAGTMENRNPMGLPPEISVNVNFLASFKVPVPEPVKMRSESGRAYLDFARGQSVIRTEFGNNSSELAKIGSMIQTIKSDPNITITQILIDGYASPEGTYASNLTLSGKRAAALKDYMKNTYGLRDNLFRVTGRGEDWNTLTDMIEASDEMWRQPALDIINSSDIFDGREKKLMELQGGGPYRWMLENMFPKLRRSDYEVKYSVLPFTVEEGKRTLETNPSLLSLNEMFLIAQSYPVGSDEFSRVFRIACEQYPESDAANLNAAANALARQDYRTAQVYLNKVKVRDAAWDNNMGVACAFQGEYDKASAQFEKAAAAGSTEAAANLAEIAKVMAVRQ